MESKARIPQIILLTFIVVFFCNFQKSFPMFERQSKEINEIWRARQKYLCFRKGCISLSGMHCLKQQFTVRKTIYVLLKIAVRLQGKYLIHPVQLYMSHFEQYWRDCTSKTTISVKCVTGRATGKASLTSPRDHKPLIYAFPAYKYTRIAIIRGSL